jgi:hypothetical protein
LERGGGAVPLPFTEAVILALKEAHVSTGAEVLPFPEGFADASSNPIAKARADPEILADSKVLPNPEVLANPKILANAQTHSGSET